MSETPRPIYDPVAGSGAALAVLPHAQPEMSDEVALAISKQDFSKLAPAEQVAAIRAICSAANIPMALSPIMLLPGDGGRLVPYVTAAGTNHLRSRSGISLRIVDRDTVDGVYIVRAQATTADGRTDEATGAVPIEGLKGVALANSFMKAETKAKRRVTMSIVGLAFLDESEIDQVRSSGPPVAVSYTDVIDNDTGEIIAPETVWLWTINSATDRDALRKIGEEMAAAGITRQTHKALMVAYKAKHDTLSADANADVVQADLEAAQLPGVDIHSAMADDPERYTR